MTDNIVPGVVSAPAAGAVTYLEDRGSIAVGKLFGTHVCAFSTADGTNPSGLLCWGRGGNGQLGEDDVVDQVIPVAAGGGLVYKAITLGSTHTCGVVLDDTAKCWGANGQGQLGDGLNAQQQTPVDVQTTEVFVRISAGGSLTCGLTATGQGFCWGDNSFGALGNGNQINQNVPVAVKQQ